MRLENAIPYLLTHFAGFGAVWHAHQEFWRGEPAGLCNDMSAFADYTADVVNSGDADELRRIFITIEYLMTEGEDDVKTAVTTCFLETLQNYHSAGRIEAHKFTFLLGPRSRDYCKSWDDYTGIETPGV